MSPIAALRPDPERAVGLSAQPVPCAAAIRTPASRVEPGSGPASRAAPPRQIPIARTRPHPRPTAPRFPPPEVFRRRPPGPVAPSRRGRHLKTFTGAAVGWSPPCGHSAFCLSSLFIRFVSVHATLGVTPFRPYGWTAVLNPKRQKWIIEVSLGRIVPSVHREDRCAGDGPKRQPAGASTSACPLTARPSSGFRLL